MDYLLILAKYVPYNISVSATTSAGNGPEVALTVFTKEGGITWFNKDIFCWINSAQLLKNSMLLILMTQQYM